MFDSASQLIERWKSVETDFLVRNAQHLRTAGEKAWNVYVVLLVTEVPDPSIARQVHWVEEDLERTRKITACGVSTREALQAALLPLLPIQHRPTISVHNTAERLAHRIELVAPHASKVALDDAIEASEVIRIIGERK